MTSAKFRQSLLSATPEEKQQLFNPAATKTFVAAAPSFPPREPAEKFFKRKQSSKVAKP